MCVFGAFFPFVWFGLVFVFYLFLFFGRSGEGVGWLVCLFVCFSNLLIGILVKASDSRAADPGVQFPLAP